VTVSQRRDAEHGCRSIEVICADTSSKDAVGDSADGGYAGGCGSAGAADAAEDAAAADGRFGGNYIGGVVSQKRRAKCLAAAALLLHNLDDV